MIEVGYVVPDTYLQDRMVASMVMAENMAWQILLWLLWCGLVPLIACLFVGNSLAAALKEITGSTVCAQQMWKQHMGN